MGRVDDKSTQHETIDDAFPRQENEFSTSHSTPPLTQTRSQVPSNNKPHKEEEEDLYYPSHDHQEKPQSFPPKNEDHHNQAYAFPPPYEEPLPQHFPPNNFQNTGMHAQQQPPPFSQVHMGQPAGSSPSPFYINPGAAAQTQNRDWNSSLFDCMNDPQNALITACFPCVTFGQIAEIVDSGNTSCGTSGMLYGLIACCIAVPCIMSCTYRTKMRGRFGLIESPGPDWIVHCFCEWCALCQEYRQLKDMGLDPSIGWVGNEAKQRQNQQFTMAPPMGQRMM